MRQQEKNRKTPKPCQQLRKDGEVAGHLSSSSCFLTVTQQLQFTLKKKKPSHQESVQRPSCRRRGQRFLPVLQCAPQKPRPRNRKRFSLVPTYHSVQSLRPPLALRLGLDLHHSCCGILEHPKPRHITACQWGHRQTPQSIRRPLESQHRRERPWPPSQQTKI